MGIPARRSTFGKSYLFQDDLIRTTVTTYRSGAPTTTTTAIVAPMAHYCERSAHIKTKVIKGPGYSLRPHTEYRRVIFDRQHQPLKKVEKIKNGSGVYQTRTISDWMGPDVSFVNNASKGRLSGWRCVYNWNDGLNEAKTKCLNKLGNQTAQIGATLAEARKTYNHLADTSTTLLRSYKALRRGNVRQAARLIAGSRKDFLTGKTSAARLLEVQYGWIPLMKSISESYDFFTKIRNTLLLVYGHASAKRSASWTAGNGLYQGHTTWEEKMSCHVVCALNGNFSRVANEGGLLNPLSIAWELVPYSFVLDWWMPVGNVLQAYSDSAGLTFLTGCETSKCTSTTSWSAIYTFRSATAEYDWSGSCTDNRFLNERRSLSSFPIPGLYNKQNWFNKKKGITALLLFRQLHR